ncbi:MAG TPA: IPT/TIG domain-containing protein [Thermoanaerobaculia bacterium]|nr:IPT/TIG domain-containing protein [Thermoanaerobaculia bacterium]
MIEITKRKSGIALLGILLLLAACKGETPTAPPSGSQNPPGGTPVTGANLVLTASNTNPIIDTTVTITATVTQNGQPVPNGTAVEFTTTNGVFTDVTPNVQSLIRTTVNGVATVNLTASTAVLARVTATVNNVTRSVDVTFRTTPACVPPDPRCPVSTAPTISSVTPPVGKPQGGETIRINGTNFIAPLRVLFDVGTGIPVEAIITNSGPTFIDVLTPAVNLGAGQQLVSDIIVVTKVGTGTEERVVGNDVFTFRNLSLTPIIHSLSPTSGPINGGTRVTIFGEGFQPPVQVFFGSAEAQVLTTDFSQILVVAPDGRSTNPDGSGTVTGPVDVRVVNINSNTRATSPEQFAYKAKMQITAVSPLVGPAVGGTDVTIDGVGFDQPIQVLFGTVPPVEAQVIRVSGTQVVVRTPSLPNACTGGTGTVTVVNIDNGDSATSANIFTFVGISPQILSATNPVTAGTTLTALVANPGVGPLGTANIRFELGKGGTGTFNIIPSPPTITSGAGNQSFNVAVPLTGFTFPSVACTVGGPAGPPGTQPGPVDVPLTFRNVTTGCFDTVTVTVAPANPVCVQAPAVAAVTAPATGCAVANATVGSSGSTSITIRNSAAAGAQSLTVTGAVSPGEFSIAPNTQVSIAPGTSTSFNVTFTPAGGPGSTSGTATFTTNDPTNPTLNVCLTGNATP